MKKKIIKWITFGLFVIIFFLLSAKTGAFIQENKDKKFYEKQIVLKDNVIEEQKGNTTRAKLEVENLKSELETCKNELVKKN